MPLVTKTLLGRVQPLSNQLMTDHCVWSPACPRHTYLDCPQVQLPYLGSLRADYLFLTVKKYLSRNILSLRKVNFSLAVFVNELDPFFVGVSVFMLKRIQQFIIIGK